MTGYHYTSLDNWTKIQKEGLVPGALRKRELIEYFPDGIKGVWVWDHLLTGIAHVGSILYQAAVKETPKIVMLEVTYAAKDRLKYKGHMVHLFHDGHLEGWRYHTGETSVIVTKTIPPKDIKLCRIYDLLEVLHEP